MYSNGDETCAQGKYFIDNVCYPPCQAITTKALTELCKYMDKALKTCKVG